MTLLAPVLLSGGAFYVMDSFNPDDFYDLVAEQKITCTLIVPSMLYALQGHPRYETADMSSMETIIYGASPMSPSKLSQAIRHWGKIFFQFYGQTEAPMVLAHLKKADHDPDDLSILASCGKPVAWMHVELLDEDNQPVERGQTGEICTRGPLVTIGYKDMPAETAEALSGDWLHTSDVGRFDEHGFLHIVEDVLSSHKSVASVMVIGVPDEKWGEAVKALVVLRPGITPSEELVVELKTMVKEAKGSQQSPKSIDFIDALPLTALGKPDKKAARSKYWTSTERAVS